MVVYVGHVAVRELLIESYIIPIIYSLVFCFVIPVGGTLCGGGSGGLAAGGGSGGLAAGGGSGWLGLVGRVRVGGEVRLRIGGWWGESLTWGTRVSLARRLGWLVQLVTVQVLMVLLMVLQ